MNEDNQKTLAAYEDGLDAYNAAAIPEVIGDVKEWIDAALAMLPKGAPILEIGSAHGRDAAYMESKGYTVDRTDAAQSFVTYLQEQGHPARLLNALTDDYGGPYAMVYASAVLLHFTGDQIAGVLDRAFAALADDGLLAFSVKVGTGDGWSEAKLNAPRYFTYWEERTLKPILEEHRFEVVFWKNGKRGHDNGDWYHVIARKI